MTLPKNISSSLKDNIPYSFECNECGSLNTLRENNNNASLISYIIKTGRTWKTNVKTYKAGEVLYSLVCNECGYYFNSFKDVEEEGCLFMKPR